MLEDYKYFNIDYCNVKWENYGKRSLAYTDFDVEKKYYFLIKEIFTRIIDF